ncbi:ABC transporter permease [Plantactinospora sp. KLBMP9567]|uniref:ABC transporter permease n=1 Tax=unclassified Plantactinospora TaxID=2631981 RepID=UPI0029813354|nr:ABC transporter permease subunit [Plantactinospora sp. KLBMP9567]MDW5324039.1 ABC transporter permease subunit [Plantactinospora sp. KLBMP9567]
MWASCRAEAIKMVRRPGTWLLLAVAAVLSLVFTYFVPYAAYADGSAGVLSDRALDALLPARLVGNSIGGLPVFVGAICLILAVLTVGAEYAWGTWKTLLTQGPSRLSVYLGKLLVLAAATLALVLTLFGVGALTSLLIAVAESQPVHWPAVGDLAVGIGGGWLISMVWAGFGVLLAVLLRGVALPIGLGLVWLLAVQNLLAAVAAPILDWVAELQKGLPGPNAGALAAALGASADAPGVGAVVGGGQAAVVLAGYLLGFVLLAGAYLHRRDIL